MDGRLPAGRLALILRSLGTLCTPSPTVILAEFPAPSGAFWSRVLGLLQGNPSKSWSSGVLVEGSPAWSVVVPGGLPLSPGAIGLLSWQQGCTTGEQGFSIFCLLWCHCNCVLNAERAWKELEDHSKATFLEGPCPSSCKGVL